MELDSEEEDKKKAMLKDKKKGKIDDEVKVEVPPFLIDYEYYFNKMTPQITPDMLEQEDDEEPISKPLEGEEKENEEKLK